MPSQGSIEYRFGRNYVYENPDPNYGPGTWRVGTPDDINAGPGPGPGPGASYDFDGVLPIVVDTTPGAPGNPIIVSTSFDIQKLNSRV